MKPEKNHLVGGFNPLKNSQLGLLFPTEWKKKHVPNHQAVMVSVFLRLQRCRISKLQLPQRPSFPGPHKGGHIQFAAGDRKMAQQFLQETMEGLRHVEM